MRRWKYTAMTIYSVHGAIWDEHCDSRAAQNTRETVLSSKRFRILKYIYIYICKYISVAILAQAILAQALPGSQAVCHPEERQAKWRGTPSASGKCWPVSHHSCFLLARHWLWSGVLHHARKEVVPQCIWPTHSGADKPNAS